MKECQKNNGFTLVELLAVIVILAIIMIIAIPSVISTTTTAKQKTFVEYVQKVRNLAEKQYLEDEMTGALTTNSCIMYKVGKEIGLDSTGSYNGYVIAVKDGQDIKYYITLYDNSYMVYGIEYNTDFNTKDLKNFTSESDTVLSKDYLAGVAGCSTYTNKNDGSTGTGTTGATGSGTGSSGSETTTKSSVSYELVSKKVSLGSYVTYKPTSTSYTALASNTGYSSDSTINPSELTSWRVLKINDDGTVDIVSTYISSTPIIFYGKTGYINFVNELQKAAASYINSAYASSARSFGYNGQTLILPKTALNQTTAPWIGSTIDNSNEANGGGDILYKKDVDQMTTAGIPLKAQIKDGSYTFYWITSRYYYGPSSLDYRYYLVHMSWDGRVFDGNQYVYYNYSGVIKSDDGTAYFRPVVTLKSTVKIAGGSGTEDDPYTLTI